MTEDLKRRQIRLAALAVFGDIEVTQRWLETPISLLNGLPPGEYALTEHGEARVRQLLSNIETGGVA